VKILQLCKKFPYPLRDGEAIAIVNLTNAFHELGHKVTLLAMNTPKHYFKIKELPEEIKKIARFIAVDVDTKINPFDAFWNLFSGKSYHIKRFISKEYKQALTELLQDNEFDIIQLEGLYLAPYVDTIRKHTDASIVLRAHNIESEIWERIADNQSWGWRRWYLRLLARRLKKEELVLEPIRCSSASHRTGC